MGDKVREAAQAVVDYWWSHGSADLDERLHALNRALLSPPQEQAPGWSDAVRDVLAERQRQIDLEGWTAEHDDAHDAGELSAAASAYSIAAADVMHPASQGDGDYESAPPLAWPWDGAWWKPGTDPRRMLLKAGALILAEIERLDRSAAPSQEQAKGRV